MSDFVKSVLLFLAIVLVALGGCSRQDETQEQGQGVKIEPEKQRARVIVPEEIRGRWKAVKIAVQDKENNQQDVYTVNIGYGFTIGDSSLNLKVENFLPYFQMDGLVLTSVSNDPRNPAAQITISDNGQKIFSGWLFSKYPNTHAFQHPRYSFSLVDFIPSG